MSSDQGRMSERPRPLAYIAAPLFCVAEREFNARLKRVLLPYVEVFLPQEDGGLMSELVASGASSRDAAAAVFAMDIAAIRRCDMLVIVLDGRVVDEGASVELGIAYALGKECVGLQTDVRRLVMGRNNPMVDCSLSCIFTSEGSLASWVAARTETNFPGYVQGGAQSPRLPSRVKSESLSPLNDGLHPSKHRR
jgi:nucleoside 2-deoxyribosyltransferase